MFQSSRTASGKPRLQASSAFSPSSASIILKSRPSRIRRATLRMTLESSTTRQVFIAPPPSCGTAGGPAPPFLGPGGAPPQPLLCSLRSSRRHGFGGGIQHMIHVEDDHELALEPVN